MLLIRVCDNGKIHGMHGILHRTDYAFADEVKMLEGCAGIDVVILNWRQARRLPLFSRSSRVSPVRQYLR
jgi:hypothetical protein